MQCDGGPGGVQLAEPDHGAIRWEALHLDPALVQTLQRGRSGRICDDAPIPTISRSGSSSRTSSRSSSTSACPSRRHQFRTTRPGTTIRSRVRLSFHLDATEPVVLDLRHVSMIPPWN